MAENQGVDLGGLISSLTANPALLSQMAGMLSGLAGGAAGTDQAAPTKETDTPVKQEILPPSLPDLSGLLSAAPALANVLGSLSSSKGKAAEGHSVAPLGLPAAFFDGASMKNRRCLLAALRPYLSPARCQSLDTVLGIMDVMTALSPKK